MIPPLRGFFGIILDSRLHGNDMKKMNGNDMKKMNGNDKEKRRNDSSSFHQIKYIFLSIVLYQIIVSFRIFVMR